MNSSKNENDDEGRLSVSGPAATQLLAEAASGSESAVEGFLPMGLIAESLCE